MIANAGWRCLATGFSVASKIAAMAVASEWPVIVRIPDLSDEVRRVQFREPADALNALLTASQRAVGERFDRDLDVDAELYRHGSDVYFSGSIAGPVHCSCPRCLEDFDWSLHRDFRFLIVKADPRERLEDDLGLDHYSGDEVDLSPLIREQAALELDGSILCVADCKGLCAGCGANLNSEACCCSK